MTDAAEGILPARPMPEAGETPDARVAPLARGLLRDTRRRTLAEAWLLLLGVSAAILAAHAAPEDFARHEPLPILLGWYALLGRTLTFHALLLLLALLGVALRHRSIRLGAATAALSLLILLAARRPVPPSPPAEPGAPRFTVASANLLRVNRTVEPLVEEMRASGADLILLQEYTDHWHRALHPALSASHPHAVWRTREDSFGIAAYSRAPFEGTAESDLALGLTAELPQQRFVVRVGGRPVAVYNIHLLPPRTFDYTAAHRRQFQELRRTLAHEPLPAFLTGDFNFTEATPQADALARLGWRDAWDVAGEGFATTWPVLLFLRYLPGLRLDHIYVNDRLDVLRIRTGVGRGSDHRPLHAELAVRAAP